MEILNLKFIKSIGKAFALQMEIVGSILSNQLNVEYFFRMISSLGLYNAHIPQSSKKTTWQL